MIGLPLAFGAPLVLAGLIALPIIWWLLRLTPPKPNQEVFPPLKILARILKKDETPHKSPWWLTLLRLTLSACVILALADPILFPQPSKLEGEGPLALVIDNSWASAAIHERQFQTAGALIDQAEKASRPVLLFALAGGENAAAGPFDASSARQRLAALAAEPVPAAPAITAAAIANAAKSDKINEIAWLSAGIESKDDQRAFSDIAAAGVKSLLWFGPRVVSAHAITSIVNSPASLKIILVRAEGSDGFGDARVTAFDEKQRLLGETAVVFPPGVSSVAAELSLPLELRNEVAAVKLAAERTAGATRLLDDRIKRKRVAVLSGASAESAQPLLSPLYYIERAIAPYAEIVRPRSSELSGGIKELLDEHPAVFVMADVGNIPQQSVSALQDWISKGGLLLRFAGPRLAASNDDALLPVPLRRGERALDGTMSWTVPQSLMPFTQASPFAGIAISPELTVSRQVLAEPSPSLTERSWADLADGTPLVTADKRGLGTVVLFHVSPNASWSNLPLTGTFVEMLQRTVGLAQTGSGAATGGKVMFLPPLRMIGADGAVAIPSAAVKPLALKPGQRPIVTAANPPGLYGDQNGAYALNLLQPEDRLVMARPPASGISVTALQYPSAEQKSLRPAFLAAAVFLFMADCLLVLWMTGGLAMRRAPANALAALLLLALSQPDTAAAQENAIPKVEDSVAISAISQTKIAYVETGDPDIDKTSQDGLFGLTVFLRDKTALEPGDPISVDLEKDELTFFPMIYWPVVATAPMPSRNALARADAYMRQGGTILFDTRDEDVAAFDLNGSGSSAHERLRDILDSMNVPPLEPVPLDHVLTKSFFLLNDFPGRYQGGELWVEASLPPSDSADRPVRTGDGVSPILITSNDFASAWAMDQNGNFLFSTVPSDALQRERAFRAGINIVMYMLTGNYKSDQVHVPALLERLGQ